MNSFNLLQLKRAVWVAFLENEGVSEALKHYEEYKTEISNSQEEQELIRKELEYSSKLFQEKIVALGDKFIKEKKYLEATKAFSFAFKNNDRDIECIKKYANCLDELKQYDLAILLYEYLLEIEKDIEPYFLIAKVYEKQKLYDKSVEYMEKYIESKGENVSAADYNLLGYFYERKSHTQFGKSSDLIKSFKLFELAIENSPEKDYIYNIALIANKIKAFDAGKKYWDILFKLGNLTNQQYFSFAAFNWKIGNFHLFYKFNEKRFGIMKFPKINKPKWDGSQDLSNSTLLIHYEQGFGDTFFIWGYMPRVIKLAKKVVFVVQGAIYELLKNNEWEIDVYSENNVDLEKLEFDYYIPSMSLPAALNLIKDNISVGMGYIKPDNILIEKFKQKYFNNNKFKIGIASMGNILDKDTKYRDIPIKEFLPLDELENIEIYNLTRDIQDSEFDIFKRHKVVNIVKESKNFADTAAMIANCDLVLTSDNCILNLSGAIGKRALGLFNWTYDYRWFDLTGEDVVYYTCVKPYVCSDLNNWQSAIKPAIIDIKKLL